MEVMRLINDGIRSWEIDDELGRSEIVDNGGSGNGPAGAEISGDGGNGNGSDGVDGDLDLGLETAVIVIGLGAGGNPAAGDADIGAREWQ